MFAFCFALFVCFLLHLFGEGSAAGNYDAVQIDLGGQTVPESGLPGCQSQSLDSIGMCACFVLDYYQPEDTSTCQTVYGSNLSDNIGSCAQFRDASDPTSVRKLFNNMETVINTCIPEDFDRTKITILNRISVSKFNVPTLNRALPAIPLILRIAYIIWRMTQIADAPTLDRNITGGWGDPHVTDFTGVSFPFHGISNRHYLLFGRHDGDMLTATMRGYGPATLYGKFRKTYFKQFGVLTSQHDQIRISLSNKNCFKARMWCPMVNFNGKAIYRGNFSRNNVSVKINKEQAVVNVNTGENRFLFSAKNFNGDNHHLEFNMFLLRTPQSFDRYVGIIGTSMNIRTGHVIHEKFDSRRDHRTLEEELKKSFETNRLFPSRFERAVNIHGIISRLANKIGLKKPQSDH